ADGVVDFLGRRDDQVKVRGFRIELGEIEAALAAHPAVERAVVVVRGETAGERRLAAYLVPRGEAPSAVGLRGFLLARLPEYMLPAAFPGPDALPRNGNGKGDRRALATRDEQPAGTAAGPLPRTAVEEVIAGFWAEVLEREAVGVDEDFFELGGH